MKRTPITIDPLHIPAEFRPLLSGAEIFDSSSSAEAQVLFINRHEGFYLKSAPKGTLERESVLTRFFHARQLAAEVLWYVSSDRDWLLTRRLPGEDCISSRYLADPVRLCDTCAGLLRSLHDQPYAGCPVPDLTRERLAGAERNYRQCGMTLLSFRITGATLPLRKRGMRSSVTPAILKPIR